MARKSIIVLIYHRHKFLDLTYYTLCLYWLKSDIQGVYRVICTSLNTEWIVILLVEHLMAMLTY
jgi:hypothetical protein